MVIVSYRKKCRIVPADIVEQYVQDMLLVLRVEIARRRATR